MASDQDEAFMRMAIQVMREAGVVYKTGGPFGAVIVKNGQVIAAAPARCMSLQILFLDP